MLTYIEKDIYIYIYIERERERDGEKRNRKNTHICLVHKAKERQTYLSDWGGYRLGVPMTRGSPPQNQA